MAKLKRAAETVRIPANADEANTMLARMGEIARQKTVIEAACSETMDGAKLAAQAELSPLQLEERDLTRGLHIWAEANRQALTDGGKRKFIRLAAGLLQWRTAPPSVRIKDIPEVIARLMRGGLTRFLRTKTEINKEAMLAEAGVASLIEGVTIASAGEDFVVEPTPFEEAA